MGLLDRIAAWFADRTAPADSTIVAESMDFNPATGLPTIAGAGTPDVAGNPYGLARPHGDDQDWQRHDRWGSGGHDHFHHHDSWSAGSHDPWRD